MKDFLDEEGREALIAAVRSVEAPTSAELVASPELGLHGNLGRTASENEVRVALGDARALSSAGSHGRVARLVVTSREPHDIGRIQAMRQAALLALLALSFAPDGLAGVRLNLEHRDLGGANKPAEVSELLLGERQVKMSRLASGSSMGDEMLFDADLAKMWVIDNASRSYFEMDRERAKATGGQLETAMSQMQAQMEAQLKNLPPEQRAMVEQAMKARMPAAAASVPPKKEIRRTSDRAEKQGHPCRRVEVWSDGEKQTEHWVTDWKELGLTWKDVAVLEELGAFMSEISASLGRRAPAPGLMEFSEEMGGLPVVSIDYRDGRAVSQTTLGSLAKGEIAPDELRLPTGYSPNAMPGMPSR